MLNCQHCAIRENLAHFVMDEKTGPENSNYIIFISVLVKLDLGYINYKQATVNNKTYSSSIFAVASSSIKILFFRNNALAMQIS